MNIRLLGNIEKQYIKDLYLEAFDDPELYVEYYVSEFSKNTDTYACIEDGKIISMANIHYKRIRIAGEDYEAAYIYGVATIEQYKHQGIMKQVLSKVIKRIEQNGIYLIYLIPQVAPSYYESLGFKLIRGTRKYNIYDGELLKPEYKLEKTYSDAETMKKHMKELLTLDGCGYISYKVFPVMVLENENTCDLVKTLKVTGDIEQNIDVNDISTLEEIYGDFLNNEDV